MRLLIFLVLSLVINITVAQSVAINNTGAAATDSTAMLEVSKASKAKISLRSPTYTDTTQFEMVNQLGTSGTALRFTFAGEEALYLSSVSDLNAKTLDSMMTLRFGNAKIFMGLNVKTPDAVLQLHDNTSSSTTLKITNSSTGSLGLNGLALYQNGFNSFLVNREAGNLGFGTSNVVWGGFNSLGNLGLGAVGGNERLAVTGNVQLLSSNKGIILDAQDRPMITRGFDAFTSGNYAGLGRWGLFMEPSRLTFGIPDLNGTGFEFARYNSNSTRTTLLNVDNDGAVTRPSTGGADLIPYAYGTIDGATGSTLNGSGNFSSTRFGTGSYGIYFTSGLSYSSSVFTTTATPVSDGTPVFIHAYPGGGSPVPLIVRIVSFNATNTADRNFSFIVYKPN